MVELMLDIETLGKKPGCVILSIAAVPFNVHSPLDYFYEKVSAPSCIQRGLHTDDDTVAWWGLQSTAAREEAFSGTQSIDSALMRLAEYCAQLGPVRVWGNGASFDAPILEAAFAACKIKVPWQYYNSMCFRTMKAMFKQIPYDKPVNAHNALEDAKAQAAHLERIFKFVKS